MLEIAIIPYRTMRFAGRYGLTVRDLMMWKALEQHDEVATISWFERPQSVVEAVLHRKLRYTGAKTRIFTHLSWDLLGPLTLGRQWPRVAMKRHEKHLTQWLNSQGQKVVLDFHPFYIPPLSVVRSEEVIYWYDLIDNFAIHNVFNEEEKGAVREKYKFARQHADLITGVSSSALSGFDRGITLPNKLNGRSGKSSEAGSTAVDFDFGFTGFITDKFDVSLIRRLSGLGYRTLIRGHAYNKSVASELSEVPGVEVGGAFHASEQQSILSRFKVGLIPYRPEKSHDESPIKLVQYLASYKTVLASKKFGELEDEFSSWVVNYNSIPEERLGEVVAHLIGSSGSPGLRSAVDGSSSLFWEPSIAGVVTQLQQYTKGQSRISE